MRQGIHRLAGAAALAVGASLALAPAASADFSPYTPFPEGKDPGVDLAAQPLIGVRIAVDPGHSGGRTEDLDAANRQVADGREGRTLCSDPGFESADGYTEHEFAFEVSEQLAEELEDLGASVWMTRTDDDGIGPCVDRRGTFAEDHDVDLMVSVHASSTEGDAPGFAAVVADPPLSSSQREPSRELAEELVRALGEGGFTPNEEAEDAYGAIVPRSDDATLNFARRPAVLVELGELRDSDEAELMASEEGQQRYVEALIGGVAAWVHGNR